MKIFQVNIVETSCRTIYVQAENVYQADERAEELYNSQEILLDYNDFTGVQYEGELSDKTAEELSNEELYL